MTDGGSAKQEPMFITVEDSYVAADRIMRERATSFYQAFHYLPEDRFAAVAAVYAFCRYADDTVDSATEFGLDTSSSDPLLAKSAAAQRALADLKALDHWLDYLENPPINPQSIKVESQGPSEAWTPAFVDAVRRFAIPVSSFRAQIAGQRTDANFQDCESIDDLIEYGRLVAGSVGTMMLPILATDAAVSRDEGLLAACENLGIGMQITNILRDVGEDLRTRNRVYLPSALLQKYGLARIDLEQAVRFGIKNVWNDAKRESFIAMWEELSLLADSFYKDYEAFLPCFHPSARLPLVAAALSYHAIADAVRENEYDCISRRCYTTQLKREAMVLEAQRIVSNTGNNGEMID